MRSFWRKVLLLTATLAFAGCARGPDEAGLQGDVQAQLDTLFGSRMLEVRSLRRQGSAPLVRAKDGRSQAIVYYNAVLAFTAPYDPSDWSGLSPELIANALGATDQGVIGLGAGRMAAGAELRAYGSMVYGRADDGWQASLLPPAAAKPVANVGGAVKSTDLIERLAGIVNTTPGLHAADDAIITEELDQALQNIKLRLNRGEQGLIVATGPAGGEYARFIDSLRPRGARWSVTHANTRGSVANALMIDSGEARYALVQSDVAAAAVTGQAAFATYGPLRHLRAVAALFPEPVHVVIRGDVADSIHSVSDLRGKRIAVGSRGSGTRQTAMQVLRAHDLGDGDYVSVDARSPEEALQLLADGNVDAVVEVVSAPWRQLATAAAQVPMSLLPLDAGAMTRVSESVPGLVPLAIPDRTYSQQQGAVDTLAATALLVAADSVPDASVKQVLDFLFKSGLAADRGVSASRLSRERALAGVTIPLHDGAADYFAAARVPAVEAPAAATQ
ncbi:MAG: TAXI family TRAP transporter solute-binding subunit [Proteobacteria bacterium]|nr:TAXI family TRAP transporter solute-binding subunit [Pseudomonadota bacterium]